MKSQLTRMKSRASGVSTRSLALVLSFVMLLTAIGAGTVLTAIADELGVQPTDAAGSVAGKAAAVGANAIDTAEDTQADPDVALTANVDADEPDEPILTSKACADLAGTGWSTSGSGIAMSTEIYTSSGEKAAWAISGTNSSWYTDFDILTGGNYQYKIIGDKWFGSVNGWNTPAFSDSNNYDYGYNAHNNGDSSNISANFPAGQYVLHLTGAGGSSQNYISYTLYRKKAYIDYGWGSGSWSSYNMSYDSGGDGVYKYTITGNGSQLRFRTRFVDGATETKYYPSTTDNIRDNTSYGTGYGASTGTSDNYWYIDTQNGATYNVWLKNGKVWITISGESAGYYLTGWLNNGEVTGNTYAFTNTSGNTWTYTFTPTADNGGYQYFTIKKVEGGTTTAYHPASHNSGSGTAGTNTDSSPGGDNKWRCAAVSGQTVTLTWDSSTHVLSWTVSGGSSGGSGDWKYTKNHADASPEKTGSAGAYRFVWANNDNGPGKSGTTAITPKLGSNDYWADITTYCKNNSQFYFGLSSNENNSGLCGTAGSNKINETAKTSGSTVTMTNGSGATIFYVEMKHRDDVLSSTDYILIRGVDWTKISNIGVLAYYTGSGAVDYKFYYKEVGSGGSTVSTVTVYAKDGAAPINWDSKGSGGASATTGTKYNMAVIASTKITKVGSTSQSLTSISCGDSASQYQTKDVEAGQSITVTTTINSSNSWRTLYYVKGWCINGVTYKCNGTPGVNAASDTNSSGVCTLTYTIPAEPEESYLEITPIYYLRDNSDCITFYLEGYNTVQEKWGNTAYIYPFYGDLSGVDNSFGVYPGQPMVYYNGQYSIEITEKNDPIINATSNTGIKGITINNGYADHVHRNLIYHWTDHDNDADHKQTYDYDDFDKIYNECTTDVAGNEAGHPNAIIFRIQDETETYNRYTYGGSKSGARVVATKSTLTATDLTNINSNNGWEVLRNRYGQPIDLFGTVVSEPSNPTTVSNGNVRVVSTGYNANIAGDYGTAWKVYKYNSSSQYSLIQDTTNGRYAAPPSIFVMKGDASGITNKNSYTDANHSVVGVGSYTDSVSKYEGIYKSAYGDSAVKGKPVYITYEKDAQDTRDDNSGTGAYRLDGRWYYTHLTDSVTSTLGIEHWDNSTGAWVKETVTASSGNGNTSGTNKNNVQFDSNSYLSSSNKITSKSCVINNGTTLNFAATAGTGYIFEGWYIKYSDTSYDKIVGAGASSSIKATANYELVARFQPIVTGSLTIDHKLSGSSTGEGSVDMMVLVKDGSTTKATYTGSHVYIDGTYISNSYSSYTIDVTLKTTPTYDGKVSAFGYDKFNTTNSITATTSPSTLPGSENSLTTSHFTFTVSQLYAGSTLTTNSLLYTSLITDTPHYYNFLYNVTLRDGTSKSYTSKGEISLKEYKEYCTNSSAHTLNDSIIAAKAPFESNFLKQNSLSKGAITYGGTSTHTFSATSNFNQSISLPSYTVKIKLPYSYYTSANASASPKYKKYTVQPTSGNKVYNSSQPTFELMANYDEFVTVGATETAAGAQTNVSKVTDTTDVNHYGNNFITAAETLTSSNGSTTYYFQYWEIRRLADSDQANAPLVSRIYYPDLNYRIYGDYYIEAKYSTNEADYWHNTYDNTGNESKSSVLYLGDSRNQWNDGTAASTTSSSTAADKIYSDFMFAFNDNGAELKNNTTVKIGYVIERVVDETATPRAWAKGSSSVTDMNTYKATYGSTEATVKSAILSSLSGKNLVSAGSRSGCVFIDLNTANLNNRNYIEDSYSVFSQYGQKVGTNSIEYNTNSAIDDYVYRVYAVMKDTSGEWHVSDAAYFSMRYTANLNYSE